VAFIGKETRASTTIGEGIMAKKLTPKKAAKVKDVKVMSKARMEKVKGGAKLMVLAVQ
jgi:hypothetical protein